MKLSYLTAISPIDGRYGNQVVNLRKIFSEFGLLKFRVQIEIKWLQKLSSCNAITEIPLFNDNINNYLNGIIAKFSIKDAKRIKTIERITNHDVKSVEYFLKEKISLLPELEKIKEFIHFACTSDDINNLAYALMLSVSRKNVLLPNWKKMIVNMINIAKSWKDYPMLSRTHGQPATPSTFGKEIANFAYRMIRQYRQLKKIKILGKINGAVGNYNAHIIAYPKINWHQLSKEFVTELGINWNPYTTQIEPRDYIAEFLSCISRFNTIVISLNRDIWRYIALNYFKQHSTFGEIGSSTMPNKINPIDLEKAEGNLGLSNAIIYHLIEKLPISRWQRDLTDSTVLRNLGACISYSVIAYQSTLKGLNNITINDSQLRIDLNKHWEILAEPIQTIMRKYKIKKPYEQLQKLTKGKKISKEDIFNFINNLSIPNTEKNRLKKLTPSNYIGLAPNMVDQLNNYDDFIEE